VKICSGTDFTKRASVLGGRLNVSSGWPRYICIVVNAEGHALVKIDLFPFSLLPFNQAAVIHEFYRVNI
jgi:hypothetical protein